MEENFEKKKKTKKNQAEIRRFTSTIQMVLNSPLSWTLIAVQKKGKLRELWPAPPTKCRGGGFLIFLTFFRV